KISSKDVSSGRVQSLKVTLGPQGSKVTPAETEKPIKPSDPVKSETKPIVTMPPSHQPEQQQQQLVKKDDPVVKDEKNSHSQEQVKQEPQQLEKAKQLPVDHKPMPKPVVQPLKPPQHNEPQHQQVPDSEKAVHQSQQQKHSQDLH
ncbi:hypothetical protein SK128_024415, partial [Halocaridina rubra]